MDDIFSCYVKKVNLRNVTEKTCEVFVLLYEKC